MWWWIIQGGDTGYKQGDIVNNRIKKQILSRGGTAVLLDWILGAL